jgi:hypothetical protein
VFQEERLRQQVAAVLGPGATVRVAFHAVSGIAPWLQALLVGLCVVSFGILAIVLLPVIVMGTKQWVIATTDDELLVIDASAGGRKPKSVVKRLPRNTRIGPVSGGWATVSIDGQKMWIHRRFHRYVHAVDSAPIQ